MCAQKPFCSHFCSTTMSRFHTLGLYILVPCFIVGDLLLLFLKTAILGFCLALLHVRKSISVIGGFLETTAECSVDLLLMMGNFSIQVIEGVQGQNHGNTDVHRKYTALVADALEEVLKTLEAPEMDGLESPSKHRFLAAFHQYFHRRKEEPTA